MVSKLNYFVVHISNRTYFIASLYQQQKKRKPLKKIVSGNESCIFGNYIQY